MADVKVRWEGSWRREEELLIKNILKGKKIHDKPEWVGQLMCSWMRGQRRHFDFVPQLSKSDVGLRRRVELEMTGGRPLSPAFLILSHVGYQRATLSHECG